MSDGLLLFAALAVAIAGMGCLALSIGAHWKQIFAAPPLPRSTTVGLRLSGSALLAVSFFLCSLADPVSMAALVWPMLVAVAGAAVAASLTVHAQARSRKSPARDRAEASASGKPRQS